jgi:hypothetical protein
VVYVSLDLRVNVSGEVISMSMIASLIAPVTSLLDKWIPDADVKQQIAHELATMSERHAQELAVAQIKLNTAEAQRKLVSKWMATRNRVGLRLWLRS